MAGRLGGRYGGDGGGGYGSGGGGGGRGGGGGVDENGGMGRELVKGFNFCRHLGDHIGTGQRDSRRSRYPAHSPPWHGTVQHPPSAITQPISIFPDSCAVTIPFPAGRPMPYGHSPLPDAVL